VKRPVHAVLAALVLLLPLLVALPAQADVNEASAPARVDLQRRLTLGNLHTCAVLDTGGVQCWGSNDNGQLGNGTTVTTTTPVLVSNLSAVRQLSAGGSFTCALVHGGSVRCWGLNGNGQLGDGTTDDSLTPVLVPGLSGATAVAAGGFHTCAITATGTVSCWGHDGMGQLGDGPLPDGTPDPMDNPPGTASSVPVDVEGITAADPAVALALGEFHSCAVLASGAVRCWGHNGFGQVGDGTTTDRAASIPVAGLPDPTTNPAVAITAGSSHTCVLLDDDTLRCWGANDYGQLGHKTAERPASEQPDDVLVKLMVPSPTPLTVQVDSDADPGVDDLADLDGVTALSAGQYHACALTSGGAVRCWGQNQRGQLGHDWKPLTDEWEDSVYAWPVAGLAGIDAVGAGGFHSCALDGTSLSCWGYDFYGQLGGYRPSNPSPVAVTALTGAGEPGAVQVSAGTGFACALLDGVTQDQPACWGDNTDGRLGSGSGAADSQIRQFVAGITQASAIDAGNGHACALPAGSSTPQCWGAGGSGQLGDGGASSSDVPVTVSGLTDATQVSAGGGTGSSTGHTCAVRSGGTVACWGENGSGQLGDGSTTDRATPVTVQKDTDPDQADVVLADLTGITAVATGGVHSCALDTGGHVWCWGTNGNGQLGDATTTSRPHAYEVQVDTDPDVNDPFGGAVAVAAGDAFSCARLGSGAMRCWGANGSGQLGDGTTTQRLRPTAVTGLPVGTTTTAITTGGAHTCATLTDGSMACWGENGSGQLGDGSTTDSPSPVLAFGPAPSAEVNPYVLSISGSRVNTCAALKDTTVACWGDNAHGQLGDGIGPSTITPVGVGNLQPVAGNHIPEPVDDTATTTPGVPAVVNVLANDTDPDPADVLTVLAVADGSNGSVADNGDGTVTFTPVAGFCGDDTFTYTVTDGQAAVSASVTVEMNCAPVAVNDAVSVVEDTATSLDVLANDTDPDSDPLTVVTVTPGARGTVAIDGGGTSVTYSPAADACGPPADAFTYTISDGQGHQAQATVTVTLTCTADAPVAGDDNASTPEDTPVTIDVLGNDSDPDGGSLSLSSVTSAAHGTTSIQGSAVRYSPAADYCGPDTFTYTVSDGSLSDTASVSVAVTCEADSPRAFDDVATTLEDTAVVVAVLANDTDPDAGTLTVTGVDDPPRGTAAISGGGSTVTYTPDADYCGSDGFTYTVSNGSLPATADVEVSVGCVNDAPVAVPDAATTTEDVSVHVHVLTNDIDVDGDQLTVVSATDPTHGSVAVLTGSVVYTPDPDWCGGDTFDVTVRDPAGLQSVAAVTVTVTCRNDLPSIAAVGDESLPWGDPLAVLLSASDPDPGDVLTYSLVTGPSGLGVSAAGAVSWVPAASQVGAWPVTVQVSDGTGTSTAWLTVTVLKRATTLTYTGQTAGVYSDLLTVRATLLDAATAAPLEGRPVTFSIGASSASASTGATGEALTTMLPGPVGAGTVGSAFAGSAAYLPASDSDGLTVARETASVTVTGQHLVLTSGGGSTVTVTATLTEEADASLGNALAGSTVTFRHATVGGAALCTGTASAAGTGQATASCTTGVLPIGSRAFVATVTSPRYTAGADVSVVTVASVGKGAAAGAGVAAGEDFGFQLTPRRKGSPTGDAVHVVPGVVTATVLTSTSPASMSVTCSGGGSAKACAASASLGSASAVAVDLVTGTVSAVAGTSNLAVNATDRAEPSGGSVPPDGYAVAVTGSVPHTLGSASSQVTISRGNIRALG
jgi:alpha-tubulin suppressor-like RCC1 family protein